MMQVKKVKGSKRFSKKERLRLAEDEHCSEDAEERERLEGKERKKDKE